MSRDGSEGFSSILKRWVVSGLGVWLGSYFVEGIHYEANSTLLIVVLLLGLFSAVLKPILVLLALPFVVLTLGLGILFINALLYLLVGELVPGFEVVGFGAAFWGALWVTFLNILFGSWIGGGGRSSFTVRASGGGGGRAKRPTRKVKAKDDVIDI
ncbi:phage holin family protein [Pelagicoccus sp. SDUM812005]|uniref:phage holin family protein n=1 Tax=Pelagicoccus sp. SDUM812005 TaxID=3041257 RepID=UPI00280CF431|nr:phage holin family protein [Pelagicoccus sp. SDUM812005]MDQ8179864.1 phage holin family protein [Pelagicoccus sp. SDUM812005]